MAAAILRPSVVVGPCHQVDALILVGATGYPVERPLLWRLGAIPGVGQALLTLTPRFMVEQNLREATARPDVVTDAVVQWFQDLRVEGNRESLRRVVRPMAKETMR